MLLYSFISIAFCHFTNIVQHQSRGDAKFADGLAPLHWNVVHRTPKLAGEHERIAWQISCNWQRERHPLWSRSSISKLAEPTAVHVSILQANAPTTATTTNGVP